VSCKIISIDELDNIIPVNPPIVNIKMNPIDQITVILKFIFEP
jgi:hypothetical protein